MAAKKRASGWDSRSSDLRPAGRPPTVGGPGSSKWPPLSLRIDPELRAQLQRIADAHNVSLAQIILGALRELAQRERT